MDIMIDGTTLVLQGDFDVRSTMEVRNALYELLAAHEGDVVVDLSAVATIDLTALKVLAVASRQAARDGHHVLLRGCRPAVRRMLLKTHIIRLVELERDVATA